MDAAKRYFRSPAAVIGLVLLLIVVAMAISASWLYPHAPLSLAGRPLIWPFSNPRFLLGTDNSGRDIAAQIFYGARISLLIGGVATAIAISIGVLIGAFAGFYGGWIDNVLMRITEAFQTLPNFVLPGDVSASRRYWTRDVIDPWVEVTPRGTINSGDGPGFGYTLDLDFLASVRVALETLEPQ